ncbi:hypothetical protein GJAV_G00229030 [Gymnothorax javanicus]|nr:hypothetical protein GJAV_G00229030 [Gymnothorax javanicus]
MLLRLAMESNEGGEGWVEDQWEKWLTQDIGLNEFEDADLSEITDITDDCGMSINFNSVDFKGHMMQTANLGPGKAQGRACGRLQAAALHLDLIDAAGESLDERAVQPSSERPVKDPAPVAMDTYRPKRPTTLNLFPQVPRTQDTLNNNSFGKKASWQEKVSCSSSPLKTGELSSAHEHACLSDEDKAQHGVGARTKDKGTSGDAVCQRASHIQDRSAQTQASSLQTQTPPTEEGNHEQICDHTGVRSEPAEEIYLTPGRRSSDPQERERHVASRNRDSYRMSISSDAEGPPSSLPLPNRANPSISEEEEVYFTAASCVPDPHGEVADGGPPPGAPGAPRTSVGSEASGLSYDSVKYTLVVDEHAQLELVSLRQCYQSYSDDSDSATVYDNCVSSPYESALEEADECRRTKRTAGTCQSEDSSPEADLPFSRKFLNVFTNARSRSSSAESFGLFSCCINGTEVEQSHRAVFRFVPRHADELAMETDDPLFVEVQAEDFWCDGYNMRTGAHGIFPAYYALEVIKEPVLCKEKSTKWVEKFRVKFLGSVQVPYHKGTDVLCAAMQKIATNRRLTVQFNPPASCILEITIKGVKIAVQDEYSAFDKGNKCSHFFHLKNVSFCGYHPKNNKYFGFITKHPADQRFACHVFVAENSMKPVAESVGRAFKLYYKEFVEFTCPPEDIYIE